uniref:SEA domain-containing protein n=1 Tax=Onchocerca volvulus TaxID=6282 RepID=A0A8R1TXB5_ONCVO
MQSVEDQFQFELATKLKSIRNIDGIDYQWPKFKNIVTIAGSMLRFRTTIFNFDKFQKQVDSYKQENEILKENDLDIAILRIDHDDDSMPQYQIVVLAQEGAKRPFDEQIYYGILKDLAGLVQKNFGDFVLIFISLFAIGAIVIAIIFAVKHGFISFRRLPRKSFYEAVHWRSRKTEDELELLRNDEATLTLNTISNHAIQNPMNSESEHSSTFENIAFSDKIIDEIKEK